MKEDEGFGAFLAALREFRRDEGTVRPTAHTSSVSTADWRQVEERMAEKKQSS